VAGCAFATPMAGANAADRSQVRLLEIHLRSPELSIRLGAHALRIQRFDLPLRQIEVCARCPDRRSLLVQLRRELLGILIGAPAVLRQRLKEGLTTSQPRASDRAV